MHCTGSYHAAAVFQTKPFTHIDGVIVPVPDIDSLFCQLLRYLARVQAFQAEGISRNALIQALSIAETEDPYAGNSLQEGSQLESLCGRYHPSSGTFSSSIKNVASNPVPFTSNVQPSSTFSN